MTRDEGAANALGAALEAGKLGEHDGDVVGTGEGDDLHYLLLLGCALACWWTREAKPPAQTIACCVLV